jgi:hypothetical protein
VNRISARALVEQGYDLSAKYVAAREIHDLFGDAQVSIGAEDIAILDMSLKDFSVSTQKRAYFYYRTVAEALCTCVLRATETNVAALALSSLASALFEAAPPACRAASETLASLPLSIKGPRPEIREGSVRGLSGWDALLKKGGVTLKSAPFRFGRSLAAPLADGSGLLVVKIAGARNSEDALHREAAWMSCLRPLSAGFAQRFDVPEIIEPDGEVLFRLEENRTIGAPGVSGAAALAFRAHVDYFRYPNDHRPDRRLTPQSFLEVMTRNAWLFGRLTGLGIIHEAPIPLFHNRVQAHRRNDNGLYQWPRGGRLDRWLESCRYPNFGMSGIRDFEHFSSFEGGGRRLHHHVGAQLLSLLLVTGSYFRNQEGHRVGRDASGRPMDARDLFDPPFMGKIIRSVFEEYYRGFVGETLLWPSGLDLERLTRRMVEEMGVDRHMEEILRVADQVAMSDDELEAFLEERGYGADRRSGLRRGEGDIILDTGPHLGGFNEGISLPEMIEAIGAISGLCVAGLFWKEKLSGS